MKVLISYTDDGAVYASQLEVEFKNQNVCYWIDKKDIKKTELWLEEIDKALTSDVDYVLGIITNNYLKSIGAKEAYAAISKQFTNGSIRFIPLFFIPPRECKSIIIPSINGFIFADNFNAALLELIKFLKSTEAKANPNKNLNKSHLCKILIDQAHRQNEWYFRPTAQNGYKAAINEISPFCEVKINKTEKFSDDLLENFDILIFPTPFGIMIDEDEYDSIASWVFNGHGLLTFGTYLMESHLYTNLNSLIRRFGFEFQHDLIMPIGKEEHLNCLKQVMGIDRDLWVITEPSGEPSNHVVLENVKSLGFQSSCSVLEGLSYDLKISTGEKCAIMHALGPKNPSGKLLYIDRYVLNKNDKPSFLIARKYGQGRIVGIGSVKMFSNEFIQDSRLGNKQLFLNIIKWLNPK